MKQYVKQFAKTFSKDCLSDCSVDTQLNMFLHDNPNFEVKKMAYWKNPKNCEERLVVVFLAYKENEP